MYIPFTYKAEVTRVVDGDTIDVELDLGFSILMRARVRLLGIDTPESRTRDLEEKKFGLAAKDYLKHWIEEQEYVMIESTEKGFTLYPIPLSTISSLKEGRSEHRIGKPAEIAS